MKKDIRFIIAVFSVCSICIRINAQQFSDAVKQFISVNSDTLALLHAKIIDGTGGPSKPDQTILIINGKIAKVGNSIPVPGNAKTIDCSGKTVIPGMIMMHEHLFYGEYQPPYYLGLAMPSSFPKLYLAGGVTTMRTTGSVEPQTDLNIRNDINSGKMIGPNLDVTGPYIEREGIPIPEMLYIKSPEDAAKEVNYWADMGCSSFKLYMDLTRADAKAAIDAAHKRGIKITGHLCSITFREAADLGIDNLEHGFYVSSDFEKDKKEDQCNNRAQFISMLQLPENSEEMKSLAQYLIKKNVAITSTLPVFLPATGYEIFPGGGGEALVSQIKEKIEKEYSEYVNKDSIATVMLKKEMFWEKQFVDMGGRLLAGIDPTGAGRVIPGYADRIVPELLMEAGFTLTQAIKICSLNAAEYLGKQNEIGTINVGKRADLVLINGDPEKNISDIRNTEIVFKNGVGFDSKKIFESVKEKVGLY
ncbi:MAG: amidohydrolase family protein [Bacteroidetes bacterium]|nr:amidohydrolase family protein [Bacteroidota bacterium]MBS1929918.1 amidohydrolase family protein [Bacteroidota bacterium]